MSANKVDMAGTDLPARIQGNLIAYMRLFAGLPGMAMHDGEAFWFVSGRSAPGDNILRADWSDEQAEAGIDATLRAAGRLVGEISWLVFPGDRPADLGERLAARGMPGGPAGNWLWADLRLLGPAPAAAGLRVERVGSDEALAAWVRVSEAGFETALGCYFDAYARHGYGPEAESVHYTGYVDGTPVASATLLTAGGSAAIYDVSTPRAYRGQGYGGAITHALMRAMRDQGETDTWIWSSDMARRLYQALGYVDADFGICEHVWRRRGAG